MATKIILVGHGTLGRALVNSVSMIMGPQDENELVGVDFTEDDSRDTLQERVEEAIIKFNLENDHLVVCCDMKGGTPFNACYLLSKQYPMSIICGMNLPMLLEFIVMKDMYETKEQLIELVEMTRESLLVI